MPKGYLCFPWFWRSEHSPKPKPPQADPLNANIVFSSSRPSSEHGLSQQGQGGLVTAAPNISNNPTGQFDPGSQLINSLVEPNSAKTFGPPNSVAPPPVNTAPPSQAADSDPSQHHDLLTIAGRSPATASQTSLLSQQSTPPPRQAGDSGTTYIQNTRESRNVSVQGIGHHGQKHAGQISTHYIDVDYFMLVKYIHAVINTSDKFMAELLEKTIPGAAFDSSDRDPPPRCHPGTRLAILTRCLEFTANAVGEKKMRWIVGKAGVGKSAIMQEVADSYFSSESPGASIFFSINGRDDGAKAIITLAYQLAASCEPYRALIEYEISHKPSLLQSRLSVQFKKFIIDPFVHHPTLNSLGRVLIIIDGLDECDKLETQRELLLLIFKFCSTYPSSPIVWMIASRPEPHIASFFTQDYVKAVCEEEEILVDSDTARSDVEKFLRDELTRIHTEFSVNPRPQWPPEQELWKLANASGGLFVFADTVIKYIGDHTFGNPASQLNDVLKAIDTHPLPGVLQEEHPMARLNALYARILSKAPQGVMANTRKILLALVWDSKAKDYLRKQNFIVFCNWLGMTCNDAYAAIRHLSAVLDAPPRDKAHTSMLRSFHKSFVDHISDSTRSGFSSDIKHDAEQLEIKYALRILEQAPDGVDFGDVNYVMPGYTPLSRNSVLVRGPGTGGNISLPWPVDEEIDWDDNRTRLQMYKLAVSNVLEGIQQGESAFCTESCIRLVTSRFDSYSSSLFPVQELQSLVFDRSRRRELINHGILKQVPVKLLDFSKIMWHVRLQFRRPTGTATNLSHPWNQSCKHKRAGHWGEGKAEDWETQFVVKKAMTSTCRSCYLRLEGQLNDWQICSPDHPSTILFTSTNKSFVELQFVDPDDGESEWKYWLMYKISAEERRKLGSTI